jgi:tight adherence protein C
MFWIQIIIPLTLALSGLVILYSDSREHKAFIQNSYAHARKQLVEIGERQADKTRIKERLVEIGKASESAYGEFRYMQLVITAGASLLPFIGYFLMIVDFIQALSLSVFLGIGAYLIYDRHLSSLVKERRDLVESEFPPIVEMLTLAIAAGETPVSAFARIADRSDSYLSREFALVIQQVRKGRPFHEALDEMSRSLKSPTIRRFIDALVMALVRGAPIVEVLHRHVAEARINQRNLVMDKAGKAETTMMIPIVFLILPISVLFALWPSINQLSFFAS